MTKYRTTNHGYPIVLALPHPSAPNYEVVVAMAELSGHAFAVWNMFTPTGVCDGGDYTDDLLGAVALAYRRARVHDDRLDLTVKGAMARYMRTHDGPPAESFEHLERLVAEGIEECRPEPTNHLPWIAEYPNFIIEHTGGGCEAWHHPLDGGGQLAITDGGGTCYQPEEPDGEWMVGRYDAEGMPVGEPIVLHSPDSVRQVVQLVLGL